MPESCSKVSVSSVVLALLKALEFLFSKAKTTEETLTFEQLSGMGRE